LCGEQVECEVRRWNMKRKNISIFLNKKVKLVKDGFALYGTIVDIDGDYVIFETDTATSAIKYDVIQEIVPVVRGI
jgi:hypothetical protein